MKKIILINRKQLLFFLTIIILTFLSIFSYWKIFIILLIFMSIYTLASLTRGNNSTDHSNYIFVLVFYVPLIIFGYANLYASAGILNCCDNNKCTLSDGLYFSIVTWTTLGYGDCQPMPNLRLWAALQSMVGYFYMAILIAFTLNFFNKRENSAEKL